MDLLKRFLTAIAGSKKAVAAIATAILVLLKPQLAKLNIEITEDELKYIVITALTYIGSQGVADMNKEAAKIRQNGGSSGGTPSDGAPVPAEPATPDGADDPVEPKAA